MMADRDRASRRKALIEYMLRPDTYPHGPEHVHHIQTHISDVFIVSPYVYKIKKPVNLGFADFSTLEKRYRFCLREVELNRRLSDVYLGVVPICERNGTFELDGSGDTIEYAVHMRELEEGYFLNDYLRRGALGREIIKTVADKLASFYASQSPPPRAAACGRSAVRGFIYDNFRATRRFIGHTLSRAAYEAIVLYNDLYFEHHGQLFDDRVRRGRVLDCHGDLRLEHIHVRDGRIQIFDCVEFNDSFRFIDVANDVAFLAMDLDYNGRPDLGRFLVERMSEALEDDEMEELVDLYKCYRAYVRGKVESIKSTQPEVPPAEREASARAARRHFRLSLRYALFGSSPTAVLVGGMIGSGKSTLAARLSEELGFTVLSSDVVRKELAGTAPTKKASAPYGRGLYTPEMTRLTYDTLAERGERLLKEAGSVVIDATFSRRELRRGVIERLRRAGAQVVFIETHAPREAILQRLREREHRDDIVTDARPNILDEFAADYEPPAEGEADRLVGVDTTGRSPYSTLEVALEALVRSRFAAHECQG